MRISSRDAEKLDKMALVAKDCPFCGSKPIFWYEDMFPSDTYVVSCSGLRCILANGVDWCERTPEAIFEKWNARGEADKVLAQLLSEINFVLGHMEETDEITNLKIRIMAELEGK